MTIICAAAFHPFPDLPVEIRSRIWDLTVEPRTIEVRVIYHQPNPAADKESDPGVQMVDWGVKQPPPTRHLRSFTPAPAQLQTCREAREHLSTHCDTRSRYEKAFSEITTTPYDGFDPVPEGDPQRKHYVWFNFDKDMLSVGDTELSDFRAGHQQAHQIRRLRLERALSNEYFSRKESLLISRLFRNVAEVHLICLEGIRSGYSITEDMEFPCGPENVYFVDPQEMGGMMMNSVDLDAMVIGEGEDLYGSEEGG
ncbi:hypothetical protein BDP81DRAFT_325943 [Colletotrichum phormii]|uniref:2EXR domain-containing protein n=1 Tax=Colletotrichum phormii TaxID=359342 RepID=A0AAI9ZN07_9PEZI|nr:uncharacterized protein BDP81DRAFT_325943 [Colletotrichum phormii]KAK1633647.1 hypothetical protein BDP81DRAFT_325943 [Colletotrichum phormii]